MCGFYREIVGSSPTATPSAPWWTGRATGPGLDPRDARGAFLARHPLLRRAGGARSRSRTREAARARASYRDGRRATVDRLTEPARLQLEEGSSVPSKRPRVLTVQREATLRPSAPEFYLRRHVSRDPTPRAPLASPGPGTDRQAARLREIFASEPPRPAIVSVSVISGVLLLVALDDLGWAGHGGVRILSSITPRSALAEDPSTGRASLDSSSRRRSASLASPPLSAATAQSFGDELFDRSVDLRIVHLKHHLQENFAQPVSDTSGL